VWVLEKNGAAIRGGLLPFAIRAVDASAFAFQFEPTLPWQTPAFFPQGFYAPFAASKRLDEPIADAHSFSNPVKP
jgi:hypothetical protein